MSNPCCLKQDSCGLVHGHIIISSKNPFVVASTSGDLVTWVLQILLGVPRPVSTGSTERVFIANGIPTIPKKLLIRIRWGEYIRLAKLQAVNTAKNSIYQAPNRPGSYCYKDKKTSYVHNNCRFSWCKHLKGKLKLRQSSLAGIRYTLLHQRNSIRQSVVVKPGHKPLHPILHR